jgi:hypothetical protein
MHDIISVMRAIKVVTMLFDAIFRRKFVLIHTALTDAECMKIKRKLTDAGIYHETKVRGIYASSTEKIGWGRKQSQYDIYVKIEEEHRAYEAIHHN